MKKGDCYLAAGMALLVHRAPEHAVLVHGVVTGQVGRVQGKQYGHAWIEYTMDGIVMVWEVANGRDLLLPAELYYRLGRIDRAACVEYTRDEMNAQLKAHKHWGPWVDGLSPEEDWI